MSVRRILLFAAIAVMGLGTAAHAQSRPAAGPSTVADPSTRFRFVERYAVQPDRSKPEALGQYQVGIDETIRTSTERPQGAPDRSEVAFRTIYTERPSHVGMKGEALAVVRRYDTHRTTPDRSRPEEFRPLEGMLLWYHPRLGDEPRILSLSERGLLEIEYIIAAHQVFLPDLKGLLPALPSRIGDTWRIPLTAVQALLADPSATGNNLSGKLVDVRELKAPRPRWEAVIAVTGRARLAMSGETAVNAELVFPFAPPAAAKPGAKADDGTVEAAGSITELRMALSASSPISPDPRERLRQTVTRELVLQRRPSPEGAAVLKVPTAPPEPTEANSWLTLAPPSAPNMPRFSFRHPQELLPPPGMPPAPGEIDLWDRWPEPRDVVSFELVPKTGKPDVDRRARDPEARRREILANWEQQRVEVVPGPYGWLPADDWAPFHMRVYRIQAALKATGREARTVPRTYYDSYLVLFGRDECLIVTATTTQDPPTAFRKQAEAILKTFQFDPPKPGR